jgi:hypothetical protein
MPDVLLVAAKWDFELPQVLCNAGLVTYAEIPRK